MADKFVDLVIVRDPIIISDSLSDKRIFPMQPPSLSSTAVDLPERPRKTRKTKLEMQSVQKPETQLNLRHDASKARKKRDFSGF